MKGRKRKAAAATPPDTAATPFFARFLEDQHAEDAEAKVSARGGRASYTEKPGARNTTSAKTKVTKTTAAKPGTSKVSKTTAQTLKYPSDRDEWVLYPYQVEAATVKGNTRQTLKYPSDRDEIDAFVPVYMDAADAPKTASAKPKKDARVRLTSKAADIDESSY